jgi:transposase-like protein
VSRPGQRTFDPALKADALKLAAEHGAAEASRRTGIPAATIRSWRHRDGSAGPPAGADPADWAERKQAGAEDAWAGAQEALARSRELIESGDARQAQSANVVYGVLVDKAEVLERAAEAARERQVRLAGAQAELIARVIRTYLESIGLSFPPPVASTLSALLRQAAAGEPLVPGPEAEEARAEIGRQVGAELGSGPRLLPGADDGGRSFPRPT